MLRNVAQHVENGTDLVIGEDLYCGFRPENAADDVVTLLQHTGPVEDFYVTGKSDVMVQVLSRAVSYDTARNNANNIVDLFCGVGRAGISLPVLTSGYSYVVNSGLQISGPAWLGQDAMGRHEFTANMLLKVQLN